MGLMNALGKMRQARLPRNGHNGRASGANAGGAASAAPAWDFDRADFGWGAASAWAPMSYGEYYPRSAVVYAAIKARQDAIARVPLRALRVNDRAGGAAQPQRRDNPAETGADARARAAGIPVAADHPLQRLLDAPNPFWSRGDLWRATETHLSLWGCAFWALERGENGGIAEIWPLRPDKTRVIPDADRYVKGFVYVGGGAARMTPYLPEDIVWMRYFNPMDEYAGLSPVAPLRLSADMGMDAMRANRKLMENDSTPGLIIETSDYPTESEVKEFYRRWEQRFQGVEKTRRPAVLGPGMKATNLGFSPRDMEYIESLRWSLEDIARVFGVPKVMIGDLENTTFSNFNTARRLFWEDTIKAQLAFYEDALRRHLLPHFGDPSLDVAFDLSGVDALKESEDSKAKRRRAYVRAGIMSIDEARREMNLPPIAAADQNAQPQRATNAD